MRGPPSDDSLMRKISGQPHSDVRRRSEGCRTDCLFCGFKLDAERRNPLAFNRVRVRPTGWNLNRGTNDGRSERDQNEPGNRGENDRGATDNCVRRSQRNRRRPETRSQKWNDLWPMPSQDRWGHLGGLRRPLHGQPSWAGEPKKHAGAGRSETETN